MKYHQETSTKTTLEEWEKPFTSEELEAIDAAFEEAITKTRSASVSCRTVTLPSSISIRTRTRPKTRRRFPFSFALSTHESVLPSNSGFFALKPRRTTFKCRQAYTSMKFPAMNFGGRIVYCRTIEEVEKATLQISELLETKRRELGRAVLGLDIEWRPSFRKGVPQRRASVMQICGDMTHSYVLHICHSGIPQNLQSLLEDSSSIKVGVGITGDARKVFRDHSVAIKSLQDLSALAKLKLNGVKSWSLSSLVETLTSKQLLKPKNIRLGNWEAKVLSQAQLEYAATDAFASWYLYEALNSLPDLPESPDSQKET